MRREDEDGLAWIYSRVVSGRSRRTLGTFFTAPNEVEWMVCRWSELYGAPEVVVDVGAGVGAFTTAAAQAWAEAEVWSIDINPVTLGLLALRVHHGFTLRGTSETGPGIRVVLDDFTVWMTDAWTDRAGRRLILGNPPYTRMHLLPRDQRNRLVEAAGGLCGSRASLSALITSQAIQALEPADGLCLLLPAQWLESDYAQELRAHIWGLGHRRVDLRLFGDAPFSDAAVDAIALLVGPEMPVSQPIVFISDQFEHALVDREKGRRAEWRTLFAGPQNKACLAGHQTTSLGDLLEVHRGLASGCNAYFVLSDAQIDAYGLPQALFTPLIRRLRGLPDTVTAQTLDALGADRRQLLTMTPDHARSVAEAAAYVRHGELQGFDDRYLCQSRATWYDLSSEVRRPDLLIGQSTKDRFRLIENEASATILNNLYGMTWKGGLDDSIKRDLLAWLRSAEGQAALKRASRTHAMGLMKIEPRALANMPVPHRFKLPAESLV